MKCEAPQFWCGIQSSQADQLLSAGNSRPIAVQITVPGDPAEPPSEYPLDGLRATRLA
ncbi:hypothetical protein [Streptomyces sp. NPDC006971]|uniref:hypothetical protein n=1 Tax=unclassified Streptomyces TaxID=2593676 RepID=UPI0033C90046